ncbi:hypothetical protein ACS0TY_005397 [Phlomoides rotata]
MGKYMRKPKTTREVALMDVSLSHSSLGVRTRAKTLALRRLQSSPPPKLDYLELRSRCLEKLPFLNHNSRKAPAPSPKQGFLCTDEENPQTQIDGSLENPIEPAMEVDRCSGRQIGGFEIGNSEIEASLGENSLDLEARESCTGESSPCSMTSGPTSGSCTKRTSPITISNQNVVRNIPTTHEMEEFFACAEQPQQHQFIEKYNFDIANDLPLSGRYDWVRVMPSSVERKKY